MILQRYLELCSEKGVAPSTVATILGYGKSAFTRWKDIASSNNGVVSLRSEMLLKIADYFNVTTDYLCGRSEKRTDSESPMKYLASSPYKMILLDEAEGMTDKSLEQVIRMMRVIKGMQDK